MATQKYRTLINSPETGEDLKPALGRRQKRLNELAAGGWTLATTTTVDVTIIDTLAADAD